MTHLFAAERTEWGQLPIVQRIDALRAPEHSQRTSVDELKDILVKRMQEEIATYASDREAALKAVDFPGGYAELRKAIAEVEEDLKEAFPLEKEVIDIKLRALKGKCSKVDILSSQITKRERKIKECQKGFEKVKRVFPDADVIDLSCLYLDSLSNGLPAYALFNVDKPSASYALRCYDGEKFFVNGSWPDGENFMLSKIPEVFHKLAKNIKNATNVRLTSIAHEYSGTSVSAAPEMVLESSYPHITFPKPAREVIAKALESDVFSRIWVLCEVESWEVRYPNLVNGGFCGMKGNVAGRSSPQKNALIIGARYIDGVFYTFLLGALETK